MADRPYSEQTREERIASLDKIQNVLNHPDWRELYLRIADDRADMQRQMDNALDWESFVAARAVRIYLDARVINLRALVAAEKADLEAVGAEDAPLPPTDYELE